MYGIFLTLHVIVAIMLIGLILVQHGKGAQAGAAFGSGASQTVFGSQGSGGFLSRATSTLAALFFLLNLVLVFFLNKANHEVRVAPAPTSAVQKEGEKPAENNSKAERTTTEPTKESDVPSIDE